MSIGLLAGLRRRSDFSPRDVSGLQMLAASESLAGADGATIPQWPDTSGNNFHLFNNTDANRPTLATDSGFRCANFASASSQVLQWPAAAAGISRNRVGLSALAVVRPATLHNGRVLFNLTGTGSTRLDCQLNANGKYLLGFRRLDADVGANLTTTGATYAAGEKHIVRYVFSFGEALAAVYKNGVATLAPTAFLTPGATSDTASVSQYGFLGGPSTVLFNGRIFDFLIWVWTGADVYGRLLERYYGTKHGIAVA